MAVQELGHAALKGWRRKAADRVATAVGRRTRLDEDWVRAVFGLVFFALAVRYLVRTVRDAVEAV